MRFITPSTHILRDYHHEQKGDTRINKGSGGKVRAFLACKANNPLSHRIDGNRPRFLINQRDDREILLPPSEILLTSERLGFELPLPVEFA